MGTHLARTIGGWALMLFASLSVHAQGLPDRPLVFGDGHVTLGGDVSWSIAREDTGFFNYTDYERSTLRMLRLALLATVKAGNHIEVLGEIRSENGELPEPYALYLRIRPWSERNLDIQVGRIPPTFGAFARRTYAADNPLIGYPLAYQYLTSLRADALPANVDELLRMRGRGWLANYSVGDLAPGPGVPLVSAFRWDTGVQIHTGNDLVDAAASVTTGTLSNPEVTDDNGGRQLAGRVVLHPVVGLAVGGSASRGAFVSQSAVPAALSDARAGDFTQTAWGADVEYSAGYYLVRLETVVSRWTLPVVQAPLSELPLSAVAASVEGRYKIHPGLYLAARFDHLGFSDVEGTGGRQSWDAPVSRWEIGGGYSVRRNLVLKLAYQRNVRDGGRVPTLNLATAQVVFWF
ncbi:MAG: hypothetical protein ABJA98_05585 [Acidobacteriota bacterium]